MTARAKGKRTTPPIIKVNGHMVRIVGEVPASVGNLPRRQSFAWPTDAEQYAERLAGERGWKLERDEL
jgi:hypothetical protein